LGKAAKVSDNSETQYPQEPVGAKSPSTVAPVPGRCFPLRVGDIHLDERGQICLRGGEGPLRFGFAYRGIEFGAQVATNSEPRVRLTAELGKLPYSTEIGDGRQLIRSILAASAAAPHGRIGLSEADDMRLEAESSPPTPVTPANLMATVTALLLDFRPYLDLLARVLDGSRQIDTAA
jgi:hypothetical protein